MKMLTAAAAIAVALLAPAAAAENAGTVLANKIINKEIDMFPPFREGVDFFATVRFAKEKCGSQLHPIMEEALTYAIEHKPVEMGVLAQRSEENARDPYWRQVPGGVCWLTQSQTEDWSIKLLGAKTYFKAQVRTP